MNRRIPTGPYGGVGAGVGNCPGDPITDGASLAGEVVVRPTWGAYGPEQNHGDRLRWLREVVVLA